MISDEEESGAGQSVDTEGEEHVFDVDAEIISLVEANSVIWDKKHPNHLKHDVVSQTFQAIGQSLTCPLTGQECQTRWKSLRSMYARHRRNLVKTPSGASTYEILTPIFQAVHRFLGSVYAPRKTKSSFKRAHISASTATTAVPSLSPAWSELQVSIGEPSPMTSEPSSSSSTSGHLSTPRTNVKRAHVAPVDTFAIKKQKTKDSLVNALQKSSEDVSQLVSTIGRTFTPHSPTTAEEDAMVQVLLHSIRRIPTYNRTRAMCALFKTLEEFEVAE